MADLSKVRVQVLDPTTGSVIENVDVKTSDGAVYLQDGSTLRNWISNSEEIRAYIQKTIVEHLSTQHVDADKVDSVITAVDFDADSGIFTFTKHDGSTKEVDTTLEKLPIAFDCINGAGVSGYTEDDILLEITLDDQTKKYVRLSDLIDIYTGGNTDSISVSVDEGTNVITATLADGGVTNSKIANATISRSKIDSDFETQISNLENAIGAGGSVESQISSAINNINAEISNIATDSAIEISITQGAGVLNTVSASIKPESFDSYGSADAVKTELQQAISDLTITVGETKTESAVTVEKLNTAESGYVSSYVVKQNGTQVGDTINIPKDYLVKSAQLKVAETDINDVPMGHKYIDFVINTADDNSGNEAHINLDVNSLVDVYTGGETSEVKVSVSDSNEITATLADGGVTNSKIANATISRSKIDSDFESDIVDIETILNVEENAGKTVNSLITEAINGTNTNLDDKVKFDDKSVNLKLSADVAPTTLTVSGITNPLVYTTVGKPIASPSVNYTMIPPSGVYPNVSFQWYRKIVGGDSNFNPIGGATDSTLSISEINTDSAGTTMYYCLVSATGGPDVNCAPVASKTLTVVVV